MDGGIKIFTIGFTKKTAEEFFSKLQAAGVKRIIDVRLNNVSQLAGFLQEGRPEVFPARNCRHRLPAPARIGPHARHPGRLQEAERRLVRL